MLSGRRVTVGVCGSIACYKLVEVVRRLSKLGAEVRVAMTPGATRFVAPATFAAVSGSPVLTDLFTEAERVAHVELGRWAEVLVVGGATATTLERLASGAADEPVSATYLMCRAPVVLAPAMHTEMWEHPAVRRNVDRLVADGVTLVGPDTGDLASGDHGVGRLADPEAVVAAVVAACGPRDMDGLRVLVTAGPTREPLDPVRYISNHSSGRMGYALAADAVRRGAHVTLVTGPSALAPPPGTDVVRVTTAQQMLDECLSRFDEVDVVVKAAAVADQRPVATSDHKLPKDGLSDRLELEPTPDIASELGRKKGAQLLVLFAAETDDPVARAREKLSRKRADLIIANLVGRPGTGFDSETNDAALVTEAGAEPLPRMRKEQLATRIWDRVLLQLGDPAEG
ncbi:MAG TPA: bifunctional phosphopantothenoylcysteine decarboxylase/phosphopantothenate--cysteine ligase CoaBC [Actinomycetota bacterium]|nr:bifunctional phosphopantothenoylcysteine decarboxylase/phosphopantothenate--cysteine ligase CoaBC [Actinomycetota bacterium]